MSTSAEPRKSIPVTCFTGFLGKTSTILGLISQLPKDYKVVLLKNEYGDVEGTLVGQIQTAMLEIRDTMNPDRIIIESSGSAFPATLAIQIRGLASEGFSLDGVVTVIDCKNFRGYEDSSPTARIQAKYTDCLLINKHELVSERELDLVLDHLHDLNDETPKIKVGKDHPLKPEFIFGLDTKLFEAGSKEVADWEALGKTRDDKANHMDEVETRSIWLGGRQPGKGSKKRSHPQSDHHRHDKGEECASCGGDEEADATQTTEASVLSPAPIRISELEAELAKLPFDIYRVKGFVRTPKATTPDSDHDSTNLTTNILNWAFGRHEITPSPSLDDSAELEGVSLRLTMMGARGEVSRRAKQMASALGAESA